MYVLLFDDECLVCNRSIQFFLKRDGGLFHFAALQSNYGQQLIKQHGLQHIDSVVLVEDDRIFTHSTAVLRAIRFIPKWRIFAALRIVPSFVRDRVYNIVARNRHKVKLQQCLILTKEQRARFLQ